jgi:hypothetical protein
MSTVHSAQINVFVLLGQYNRTPVVLGMEALAVFQL